jgi:hypothetical protein
MEYVINKLFICEQCSKEFVNTSHKNTRKFCSKSCWASYCNKNSHHKKRVPQEVNLICKRCNKSFLTKRRNMKRQKYCSKSCGRTRLDWINILCPCGKDIKTKNKYKKYCSQSCRSKFRIREGIYSLEKHKHVCMICNNLFSRYRSQSKFCSNECKNKFMDTNDFKIKASLIQTKEKTFTGFRQKNRLRDMTRKEYIHWRRAVLIRDNYTCQRCNNTHKLEAHHIKSYSKFPELRFDPTNGIIYCRDCHQKLDPIRNKFFTKEASYVL